MATEWVASPLRDLVHSLSSSSCEPGGQDASHIKSTKEAKAQKWALGQLYQYGEELNTPWSHVFETIMECMNEPQELSGRLAYPQYWQRVTASEAGEAKQSELRESTKSWRAWVRNHCEKSAGAMRKWTKSKVSWEPLVLHNAREAKPRLGEPPETVPVGE
eukprot:9068737-Pyramimonas_sp.AAC.1